MIEKNVTFRVALPPLSDDTLVTRVEFSSRLKISLATLHRWIVAGKIPPPVRIGRRHTVWHADVVRHTLRQLTQGCEAENAHAPAMIVRRG